MASDQKRRISEIYEKALSANWINISKNLDPRDIVDHLIPNNIITIEERGDIWRLDDRASRLQKLMDIVILRGDRRFGDFLEVLKNQNYEWLYNAIAKTIEEVRDNQNIQYANEYSRGPELATSRRGVLPLACTRRPTSPLEYEMSVQRNLDVPDSSPLGSQKSNYFPPKPQEQKMCNVPSSTGASPSSEVYDDAMSKTPDYESFLVETVSNDYEQLHSQPPTNEDEHPLSRNISSSSTSEEVQNPPMRCSSTSAQYVNTSVSVYNEGQPVYSNMDERQRPLSECKRIILKNPELISIHDAVSERLPLGLREIEECPGWSPCVNDANKRKVPPTSASDCDGNFYLWYSINAEAIVLTIRKSDEKRGCLNYRIRSSKEGGVTQYFFHKDAKFESMLKLIDFTKKYGLALPEKS